MSGGVLTCPRAWGCAPGVALVASFECGKSASSVMKPACRPSRADAARTNGNPQATGQPRLGQDQEISHWSPDTSSVATSSVAQGPSDTQRSMGARTVDSTAANCGSTASNTTSNTTSSVEAERERTEFAMEHSGTVASASARSAERFGATVTKDPQAAQQMSSSGRHAQDRRG
ncbi:hypothetical protein EMCG_03944 [[Emmonsia] crescens]|uniref:Uncharacterized protein n=1 Tax=[Emmonsia] crescens TaxID=73230 RepID=A0A0G2J812_9EURO|nr:hypothetical protein EMCG_03944 [Emmonsia crescens UAMH 3008]